MYRNYVTVLCQLKGKMKTFGNFAEVIFKHPATYIYASRISGVFIYMLDIVFAGLLNPKLWNLIRKIL